MKSVSLLIVVLFFISCSNQKYTTYDSISVFRSDNDSTMFYVSSSTIQGKTFYSIDSYAISFKYDNDSISWGTFQIDIIDSVNLEFHNINIGDTLNIVPNRYYWIFNGYDKNTSLFKFSIKNEFNIYQISVSKGFEVKEYNLNSTNYKLQTLVRSNEENWDSIYSLYNRFTSESEIVFEK